MTFRPTSGAAIAALALAAAPAASAVIKTGGYDAGSFSDTAAIGLGPGTYRFSIALTTPVPFVDGFAEKQTVTNFYCIDPDIGPDEFYCGGNEVPTQPLWDQVTPTLYQAMLTVNPFRDVPFSSGFVVRYTEQDDCCRFEYGWDAPGGGSYVLSYVQVPEPASWAMMIAGFGLLGAGVRHQKIAAA